MCGDDRSSRRVTLIGGSIIICLINLRRIEIRAVCNKLIILALCSWYAGGNRVHRENQKRYIILTYKIVILCIVCKPCTVCLTDHISVDTYPWSDLVAIAVLKCIIGCDDRDTRLVRLIYRCL